MLSHLPLFIGAIATISGLALPETPVASTASAAAAPSCFGVAPTILGTGADIEGTEGPDVVITNGASQVTTLGGDDLVCITGSLTGNGIFDTGAGDDRVDSSAASKDQYLYIHLGPGADQFSGGSATEEVTANDETPDDIDRDVISTAGGNDTVYSGGFDREAHPDRTSLAWGLAKTGS